jgi:hypothetical protein
MPITPKGGPFCVPIHSLPRNVHWGRCSGASPCAASSRARSTSCTAGMDRSSLYGERSRQGGPVAGRAIAAFRRARGGCPKIASATPAAPYPRFVSSAESLLCSIAPFGCMSSEHFGLVGGFDSALELVPYLLPDAERAASIINEGFRCRARPRSGASTLRPLPPCTRTPRRRNSGDGRRHPPSCRRVAS